MKECPICGTDCEGGPTNGDAHWYKCPNCGSYSIAGTALSCLERLDHKARAVLSHGVWMRHSKGRPLELHSGHLKEAEKGSLPSPAERLDLYILFLGDSQGDSPGKGRSWETSNLRGKIGAATTDDVAFVNKAAEQKGLLDSDATMATSGGRLTLEGWEYYRELKKGKAHGRTAFMALSFRNPEVVKMVDEVFRPAVEETGFRLKRVDDDPPAGLIDNRMRVEIMTSRFLIADLTDGNQGAYWEAGFGEGQGKPVIYTCSKPYFDKNKTHFDTNHCQTVLWDADDPDKAAEDLKATIRATLPFEAVMPAD